MGRNCKVCGGHRPHELATFVLTIAQLKPHKKKRAKFLFERFLHLYEQAVDWGLIQEFTQNDDRDPETVEEVIFEEDFADQDYFEPDRIERHTLENDEPSL
jgi:hypothetical protein